MFAHRLSLPVLRTMAVALLVPILCALAPTRTPADEAGAFYSDPTLNQLTANGAEFGITSAAGYFVIGEIGYLVHAENNAPGLPGR
jgi:hypothetical protein